MGHWPSYEKLGKGDTGHFREDAEEYWELGAVRGELWALTQGQRIFQGSWVRGQRPFKKRAGIRLSQRVLPVDGD